VDSEAEGASGLKSSGDGESLQEGSLVPLEQVGASRHAKVTRQEVPNARSRGLRLGLIRTSAGHVRP
jgi:hypothetical protein